MKSTIAWFLLGIILGINSFMIWVGWIIGYYLAWGPLIDFLGTYMWEGGIILTIIIPVILWTLVGFLIGKLLK